MEQYQVGYMANAVVAMLGWLAWLLMVPAMVGSRWVGTAAYRGKEVNTNA